MDNSSQTENVHYTGMPACLVRVSKVMTQINAEVWNMTLCHIQIPFSDHHGNLQGRLQYVTDINWCVEFHQNMFWVSFPHNHKFVHQKCSVAPKSLTFFYWVHVTTHSQDPPHRFLCKLSNDAIPYMDVSLGKKNNIYAPLLPKTAFLIKDRHFWRYFKPNKCAAILTIKSLLQRNPWPLLKTDLILANQQCQNTIEDIICNTV